MGEAQSRERGRASLPVSPCSPLLPWGFMKASSEALIEPLAPGDLTPPPAPLPLLGLEGKFHPSNQTAAFLGNRLPSLILRPCPKILIININKTP